MKSRTSSFKTIFFKDITRFAPVWVLYLIGGLLIMGSVMVNNLSDSQYHARGLAESIGGLSILNLLYAPVCAQMLFGDLFHSRLCNALHALPLRRRDWFFSHCLVGLYFSLIPNTLIAASALPFLGSNWPVALCWLVGMTLHYLFFFGVAVFSTMCAGNRLGMAAVYAVINGGAYLAYTFASTVYEPLLYGVNISDGPFLLLCPVAYMSTHGTELVHMKKVLLDTGYDSIYAYIFEGLGEGWEYLIAVAVIGLVLCLVALLMYRKRHLERAGDLIAVQPLRPVFAVIFTLCTAMVAAAFGDLLVDGYFLFMAIGFVVGWFVVQMLLARTVRVFKWKVILGGVLLAVVLVGSMVLTWLDPLKITLWVPQEENVSSVTLSDDSEYNYFDAHNVVINDPQQIRQVLQIHEQCLEQRYDEENGHYGFGWFTVHYQLKNGTTGTRSYRVWVGSKAGEMIRMLMSQPQMVLGYEDLDACRQGVNSISIDGADTALTGEAAQALVECIYQDCLEGNMGQNWSYHRNGYDTALLFWLRLYPEKGNGFEVMVFSDAANTVSWLKENFELWADENEHEWSDFVDFAK